MVFDNTSGTYKEGILHDQNLPSNQHEGENCAVSNLSVIRRLGREEMAIEPGGFKILSRNFSVMLQVIYRHYCINLSAVISSILYNI